MPNLEFILVARFRSSTRKLREDLDAGKLVVARQGFVGGSHSLVAFRPRILQNLLPAFLGVGLALVESLVDGEADGFLGEIHRHGRIHCLLGVQA
jgi:hypothetical protein